MWLNTNEHDRTRPKAASSIIRGFFGGFESHLPIHLIHHALYDMMRSAGQFIVSASGTVRSRNLNGTDRSLPIRNSGGC
ncbi:MAG: hypothetical protein SFV51_11290 [Bryobacteraceae bacterium]|nr:hypothetical protein [Bryobacteraceae bacterium]